MPKGTPDADLSKETSLEDISPQPRESIDSPNPPGYTGGETEIRFRAGELFEDSIQVDGHRINALAEVEIEGEQLILKDIAVYADGGDIPNQIGSRALTTWLRTIKEWAKHQGFKELHILAQRAEHSTSANPGYQTCSAISSGLRRCYR